MTAGDYVMEINHGNTSKNAKDLRDNMIQDGHVFQPGDRTHHVAPSTDSRTEEARDLRNLVEGWGIDINDSANGAVLSKTQHQKGRFHTKDCTKS